VSSRGAIADPPAGLRRTPDRVSNLPSVDLESRRAPHAADLRPPRSFRTREVHISGRRHQGLPVVVTDVEASALEQGSYPIEMGWALGRASKFESFLIRPTEEWAKDGAWSDLSKEIHGISKAELQTVGISAPEAIARLEARLSGSIVSSDAIECDGYWLGRLFATANRPCPVKLQPFNRGEGSRSGGTELIQSSLLNELRIGRR